MESPRQSSIQWYKEKNKRKDRKENTDENNENYNNNMENESDLALLHFIFAKS